MDNCDRCVNGETKKCKYCLETYGLDSQYQCKKCETDNCKLCSEGSC